MEISQGIFFQYTTKRLNNSDICQSVNVASENNDNLENNINYVSKEGEICVANVGSTLSDEAIESIMKSGNVSTSEPVIKLSTTYKNFKPSEINKIKQLIYDLHHKNDPGEDVDPVTPDPVDPDPVVPDEPDVPTVDKSSFISEFCDADTLFEYMNTLNPSITKENGLTRAQLVALTQNDDWEDSHYDFFGSLNRIFSQLDTNNDDKLSYAEIEDFIGEELGANFIQYKNKVNLYCNEIQEQYETLSNQKKLEFAIEKAEEYLAAAGLTRQLDALNRLKTLTDKYNTIRVGQIAIADLNNAGTSSEFTLGSYSYWAYKIKDYDNWVNVGDFEIFSHDSDFKDKDGNEYDLGITLDISLLSENWYVLVNTLVHELTHATAYQYYTTNGDGDIPPSTLDKLHQLGVFKDEAEYNWYKSKFPNLDKDALLRLDYLCSCVWGEYAAYQADADYNDSIGQDVYKKYSDDSATAVDGANEKNVIMQHIDDLYNNKVDDDGHICNESIPDYKWWSYA